MNNADKNAYGIAIYAKVDPEDMHWVEKILGDVIRPVYEMFHKSVRWMWVTRYWQPEPLKPEHDPPKNDFESPYWWIIFRAAVEPEDEYEFRSTLIQVAQDRGYYIPPEGWEPYDPVADLGNDRFIRADAPQEARETRAFYILQFMDATAKLMLSSIGRRTKDDRWVREENDNENNREGDFFQSVHHLFCNATAVPVPLFIRAYNGQVDFFTNLMSPKPTSIKLKPLEMFRGTIFLTY